MANTQQFPAGTKVNLSMLIDMILQKSYHELTLLSELLPRKSDIERKIEIIQFATNTRQQFIRLLALVKWAASAEKVDQCQAISASLDQQNMFFINTADTLARMARETLVNARLPNFSLPTAVDVLTTGTFNRLPRCIKEKIIPPDPIAPADKKRTLKRLNEVIQNRLATAKIPTQFTSLLISEGRVKLTVKDEFQVTLTLMGDQQTVPWRLLKIEFLINDFETGDGKSLVHDMQIHYIHELVQSRLIADNEPLVDIYNCLHYFAMSLQLEVLHTQAVRLISEKWGDLVKVEEYITGQKLTISYWRTQQSQITAPSIQIKSLGSEPSHLLLRHKPEINNNGDIFKRNATTVLSPSCVAMENILTLAARERSRSRLTTLVKSLQQDSYFAKYASYNDDTPSVTIRPFEGCTESEVVIFTIDSRTGRIKIKIDDRVKDIIKKNDLLRLLGSDIKEFQNAFHNLRCYIYLARCASSVSHLSVQPCFFLPFVNNDLLSKLSKNRLYIRFNKHPNYILVVDVHADTEHELRPLRDGFHLLSMSPSDHPVQRRRTVSVSEQGQKMVKAEPEKSDAQKKQTLFYTPENLMQLNPDAFVASKGRREGSSTESASAKRKSIQEPPSDPKKNRISAEIFGRCEDCCANKQQLISMISSCSVRIPFVKLCQELSRAGIPYQSVHSEGSEDPFVRILQLPDVEKCNAKLIRGLRKLLMVCSVRLHESMFFWVVEYRFPKSPLRRVTKGNNAQCISTEFKYDRTDSGLGEHCKDTIIERILKDWKALIIMYEQALILRKYLEDERGELRELVCIDSFDFKTLKVIYGKRQNYQVAISWNSEKEQFTLDFGTVGNTSESNPHQLVAKELSRELNKYKNLPYGLYVIAKTTFPLFAIGKISTAPTLGASTRPLLPLQNISIVTQSSTHIRLFYKNTHAVDVNFVDEKVVVRDGSFCKSEPNKQLGGMAPAENFTIFLQRFADKPSAIKSEFDSSLNQSTMDVDKTHREGFQQMHGLHDSPGHPLSSRSPAFSSPPSHGTAASASAGPYSGQLSALSPANVYSGSSPGFIQPSPAPAQSSSMTSPAAWPHSPQVSQGSPHYIKQGVVPATQASGDQTSRSGAGPTTSPSPVLMSVSSFALLVTPAEQDFPGRNTKYLASPLQRFFDALYLIKHLVRVVRNDVTLHLDKYDSMLVFSGSPDAGLQYSVCVNPVHLETLHLNVVPKKNFENVWMQDELRVLKQFFEVVVTPCKLNILTAFARLLGANPRILKDSIKIMRMEMQPDGNQRWFIEWSFMTPPGIVASIAAPGTPAVVLKTKNLFFFQLTDVKDSNRRFVFSILYDTTKNIVQPTEFPHSPDAPQEPPSWAKSAREACNIFLKKIAESIPDQECRLYPALQALVNNFVYH